MKATDVICVVGCIVILAMPVRIWLTKQADKPAPPVPAPLTEARVRAIVIYEVERAVKKREAKPLLPEVRGCQCK